MFTYCVFVYRVRRETLAERLHEYADMAKSEGYIGLEDFAKYLNLPVSENLREMFDMYDRVRTSKMFVIYKNNLFSSCPNTILFSEADR